MNEKKSYKMIAFDLDTKKLKPKYKRTKNAWHKI